MNDNVSTPPPSEAASDAVTPTVAATAPLLASTSLRRLLFAVFALVFLLLAWLAWQEIEVRQQLVDTQQDVEKRLSYEDAQVKSLGNQAKQNQETVQALQNRLLLLESRITEFQSQQGTLEGLYQELARGRDEWMLAEVDQLVSLAAQQLQLAGNVQIAIMALTNAEARLARSARSQFVDLRKIISKDLQRLRSQPLFDVQGVSVKIENTVLAVEQMGLASDARPSVSSKQRNENKADTKEARPLWERFAAEFWSEVKSLVHVERFEKVEPSLLSPSNAFFLRENLKLRLLSARLALLARDQTTFRGEIRQSIQWIEHYFDPHDRNVILALETLKVQLGSDVLVDLPSLSESQTALRNLKLAAERRDSGAK